VHTYNGGNEPAREQHRVVGRRDGQLHQSLQQVDRSLHTDGSSILSTRAHTHRELIRGWLWGRRGAPLNVSRCFGGGAGRRCDLTAGLSCAVRTYIHTYILYILVRVNPYTHRELIRECGGQP